MYIHKNGIYYTVYSMYLQIYVVFNIDIRMYTVHTYMTYSKYVYLLYIHVHMYIIKFITYKINNNGSTYTYIRICNAVCHIIRICTEYSFSIKDEMAITLLNSLESISQQAGEILNISSITKRNIS